MIDLVRGRANSNVDQTIEGVKRTVLRDSVKAKVKAQVSFCASVVES